ncbi:putative integral membrane efflux protein [Janibacter sp. HTCC2649]|uniref:MFS transporter n=1 Tax=Janibacter sp. HTCC2649 TaxID=313589 RepID=UPI00006709B1|nr:MFS transporter [Janibacter sp. HTCC2649]EAP99631.1 putative integral membrane efflux protein [Janibacter sp. HTCC2649]
MTNATSPPIVSPPKAGRREWISLAVLCLPLLIVSMDVSVLFFAVPFIAEDLQPSATQLLWIFDIYGFVLAGLLLTMGAIGDRIGRRRLLLIGAVAFSAASLLAAWSTSAEMLIGARALMGVGGATLMPSTLALVRTIFHDGVQRAKAIGIWSAVMAGGVGLGPIIAGVLLEHVWWGSVFLVNVPVMLALLVVAPRLLPESRSEHPHRIDILSAVLVLAAVLPFIWGVKEAAAVGWSVRAGVGLVVGLSCAALFVVRQLQSAEPLLDLSLFARRGFGGSIAVNVIAQAGIIGNAILLTQYLQQVLGLSPLRAALWSLAPSLVIAVVAPGAGALSARLGRPRVIAVALGLAAAGFVELTRVQADSSVWVCLIGATLVAAGIVSVATLVTEYVVGTVPADLSGSVAGFLETTSEMAGALGIAVLGSMLNAGYRHGFEVPSAVTLPGPDLHEAGQSLAGALAVAGNLPGIPGELLTAAGRTAYMAGMHVADVAAAVLMLVGVLVALTRLPRSTDERVPARVGD